MRDKTINNCPSEDEGLILSWLARRQTIAAHLLRQMSRLEFLNWAQVLTASMDIS